jgi:hypothetical protein
VLVTRTETDKKPAALTVTGPPDFKNDAGLLVNKRPVKFVNPLPLPIKLVATIVLLKLVPATLVGALIGGYWPVTLVAGMLVTIDPSPWKKAAESVPTTLISGNELPTDQTIGD